MLTKRETLKTFITDLLLNKEFLSYELQISSATVDWLDEWMARQIKSIIYDVADYVKDHPKENIKRITEKLIKKVAINSLSREEWFSLVSHQKKYVENTTSDQQSVDPSLSHIEKGDNSI